MNLGGIFNIGGMFDDLLRFGLQITHGIEFCEQIKINFFQLANFFISGIKFGGHRIDWLGLLSFETSRKIVVGLNFLHIERVMELRRRQIGIN